MPGPGPSNEDMQKFVINLDRAKISTRAAFRTSASFAKFGGLHPRSLRISRSSLQRRRKLVRASVVQEIKAGFKPTVPLAVHWDEIKVAPLKGRVGISTRLPIIVTGTAHFSYTYISLPALRLLTR